MSSKEKFDKKEIETITDNNFEEEVLKSEKPVLVYFFARWAGPCWNMRHTVKELPDEMGSEIKIVQMDTDYSPKTVAQLNLRSIPTFTLFDSGKMFGQHVGALSKEDLVLWIKAKLHTQEAKNCGSYQILASTNGIEGRGCRN